MTGFGVRRGTAGIRLGIGAIILTGGTAGIAGRCTAIGIIATIGITTILTARSDMHIIPVLPIMTCDTPLLVVSMQRCTTTVRSLPVM